MRSTISRCNWRTWCTLLTRTRVWCGGRENTLLAGSAARAFQLGVCAAKLREEEEEEEEKIKKHVTWTWIFVVYVWGGMEYGDGDSAVREDDDL